MFMLDTRFSHSSRSKSRFSRLSSTLAFHRNHTDLGQAGERLAIALFDELGYKAYKTKEKHAGDIAVICRKTGEYRRIEVKTATADMKTKTSWQFCLNKGQKTQCCHADFVLLFAVDSHKVFAYLVPSAFLADLPNVKICSHPTKYRGKLQKFLIRGELSFQAACDSLVLSKLQ